MKLKDLIELTEKVTLVKEGMVVNPFNLDDEEIKNIKAKDNELIVELHTENYITRRYKEMKAKGLCSQCGSEAMPGKTICKTCSMDKSRRSGEERAWRIKNNLCTCCGKPLRETDVTKTGKKAKTCNKCRTYNNKNYQRYLERHKEGK